MGDLADTAERLRDAKTAREKFLALYVLDCILDETADRVASSVHPDVDLYGPGWSAFYHGSDPDD